MNLIIYTKVLTGLLANSLVPSTRHLIMIFAKICNKLDGTCKVRLSKKKGNIFYQIILGEPLGIGQM